MKKDLVQFSQKDLVELIILKLMDEGMVVSDKEFGVEFVVKGDGTASALVQGAYRNVEELENPDALLAGGPFSHLKDEIRGLAEELLTTTPLDESKLFKQFFRTIDNWGFTPEELDANRDSVKEFVLASLRMAEQEGRVQHIPDIDAWRKIPKKKREPSAADAARAVLNGSGGVMDRSQALREGVAQDKRRTRR